MFKSEFTSNAEELRYFAKQLLEDGQEHSVQEIKDYVEQHSEHSEDFTVGMYAGALRSLVQNSKGKYSVVKRGKYQMIHSGEATMEKIKIKDRIVKILDNFCDQLEEACTINIMDIEKIDLEVAKKTAELLDVLRKKQEEFEALK